MAPTTFAFMLLPPEIRDLIYAYAFHDFTIHVYSPKLHRSIGSPCRPKNRCLPAITRCSRQTTKEAFDVLAQQCTLIFADQFNLSHLLTAVPNEFAKKVRRISLKGDIVPSSIFSKFPSLRHVSYQQLGNCFLPPLESNGYNKQAMKARQSEIVDLVLGRSPALNLLADLLSSKEKPTSDIRLVAEAMVLSCHERVNVWIDVNAKQVICRRLMGVHRLYDTASSEKS